MKAIRGIIVVDGKKIQKPMVLEERLCIRCNGLFQPKTQRSKVCTKCLTKTHTTGKKRRDKRYKDKKRHSGKRSELLSTDCGLICLMCGKKGNKFQIVTHHVTHDSSDHDKQVQLCRSCHALEHFSESNLGEWKRQKNEHFKSITKEQVEKALRENNSLDGASNALGIARCSLYKLRKKFGLGMTRPQRVSLSKADLLSVAHMEQKAQAEALGVSRRTICKYRKKFGLT